MATDSGVKGIVTTKDWIEQAVRQLAASASAQQPKRMGGKILGMR